MCQPYSQDDTIGYRNFSSGFCRYRSRRYEARPWPSWEMPEEQLQGAGGTCLIPEPTGWSDLQAPELLFGPAGPCLPWVQGPGHPLPGTADPGAPWSPAVQQVPPCCQGSWWPAMASARRLTGRRPSEAASPGQGSLLQVLVAIAEVPGHPSGGLLAGCSCQQACFWEVSRSFMAVWGGAREGGNILQPVFAPPGPRLQGIRGYNEGRAAEALLARRGWAARGHWGDIRRQWDRQTEGHTHPGWPGRGPRSPLKEPGLAPLPFEHQRRIPGGT